jgi:bla regulator protein blaR1
MPQNAIERSNHHSLPLLIAAAFIATASSLAPCQTTPVPTPPATASSPPQLPPAYEVATIKPPGPNDYHMPLRIYIQLAFGITGSTAGWVIGPDWISSAQYVIHGKPPDAIRDAMQTMTPAERGKTEQAMMQALLADRFQLKAHFETREMPLYQLTLAKGGSKLKENSDASKGRASVGASRIRGTAVPIRALLGLLEGTPDIGGRVIIDKTGLTGTYDLALKWTPLEPNSSTGPAALPNPDSATLFTAIQEQLGLKLTPTKGPGQVLIIDHSERPSEN